LSRSGRNQGLLLDQNLLDQDIIKGDDRSHSPDRSYIDMIEEEDSASSSDVEDEFLDCTVDSTMCTTMSVGS
jgi:hypothetical protein